MPSNQLLISNLYTLCKQKHIKIRDLETSCGVSVGYLARLRQDKKNPLPGLDFLVRAASMLETSVDALLYLNFQLASETDLYLNNFISHLIGNTAVERLRWDIDHDCIPDPIVKDGISFPDHPLLSLDPVLLQQDKSKAFYSSAFHPAEYDLIPTSAWRADLSEDTVVFLVRVASADPPSGKKKFRQETELYLYNKRKKALSPLCYTDVEHPGFLDVVLNDLCETVSDSMRRSVLDSFAVQAIDAYMAQSKEDALE